jgi:hypothetical protein
MEILFSICSLQVKKKIKFKICLGSKIIGNTGGLVPVMGEKMRKGHERVNMVQILCTYGYK